jgi:hypothetical protein
VRTEATEVHSNGQEQSTVGGSNPSSGGIIRVAEEVWDRFRETMWCIGMMASLLAVKVVGAVRWIAHELLEPAVCWSFVYLGVLSTMLLPSILVAIPLLSPLAAIPIAIYVFDVRAHRRWRASDRARVGARVLRACSDGIMWWKHWRK